MEVLIVSGFLGAGKTTFIKELIGRTDCDLAVLENEFGSIDLDSAVIAESAPGRVVGLAEGCACCAKAGEFIGSLLTISSSLDPEYLIVEPSGIGKLSNIIANVEMATYERIRLLRSVVVVCPRTLEENLSRFGDVCEDQLLNADVVVFSKTEREDARVIERAVRTIQRINPAARIVRDHYTELPRTWWRALLEDGAGRVPVNRSSCEESNMEQVTLSDARFRDVGDAVLFCEKLVRGFFGGIVRAKGAVHLGGEAVSIEVADGRYRLYGAATDPSSPCVFIGPGIARDELASSLALKRVDESAR